MRFADLEPRFVRVSEGGWQHVASVAEAQGVFFVCPTCYVKNGGTVVGTHGLLVWSRSRGTPDHVTPTSRWGLEGADVNDFSIVGEVSPANPDGRRSILLPPGEGSCAAHFNVEHGQVVFHGDDPTVSSR